MTRVEPPKPGRDSLTVRPRKSVSLLDQRADASEFVPSYVADAKGSYVSLVLRIPFRYDAFDTLKFAIQINTVHDLSSFKPCMYNCRHFLFSYIHQQSFMSKSPAQLDTKKIAFVDCNNLW